MTRPKAPDFKTKNARPTLSHSGYIEAFQGSRILILTRRDLQPDRDFLAERYEIFRKAG